MLRRSARLELKKREFESRWENWSQRLLKKKQNTLSLLCTGSHSPAFKKQFAEEFSYLSDVRHCSRTSSVDNGDFIVGKCVSNGVSNAKTLETRVKDCLLVQTVDKLAMQDQHLSPSTMHMHTSSGVSDVSSSCFNGVTASQSEISHSFNPETEEKQQVSSSFPQNLNCDHSLCIQYAGHDIQNLGSVISVEQNGTKLAAVAMKSPVGTKRNPGPNGAGNMSPVVLMQKLPKFCQVGSPVSVSSLSRINSPSESHGIADCPATPVLAKGNSTFTGINSLDMNYICSEMSSSNCFEGFDVQTESSVAEESQQADKSAVYNCLVLTSLELADNDRIDDTCFENMVEACTKMTKVCQSDEGISSGNSSKSRQCEHVNHSETAVEPFDSGRFAYPEQNETVEGLMVSDQTCSADVPGSSELGQELCSSVRKEPVVSSTCTAADTKRRKRLLSLLAQDLHTSKSSLLEHGKKSYHHNVRTETGRDHVKTMKEEVPVSKKRKCEYYRCNSCSFHSNQTAKEEHERSCHPFCCPSCHHHFSSEDLLDTHKAVCAKQIYCSWCKKKFSISRRKQHFHSRMHRLFVSCMRDASRQIQLYGNIDKFLSSVTCDVSSKCQKCHPTSSIMEQTPGSRTPEGRVEVGDDTEFCSDTHLNSASRSELQDSGSLNHHSGDTSFYSDHCFSFPSGHQVIPQGNKKYGSGLEATSPVGSSGVFTGPVVVQGTVVTSKNVHPSPAVASTHLHHVSSQQLPTSATASNNTSVRGFEHDMNTISMNKTVGSNESESLPRNTIPSTQSDGNDTFIDLMHLFDEYDLTTADMEEDAVGDLDSLDTISSCDSSVLPQDPITADHQREACPVTSVGQCKKADTTLDRDGLVQLKRSGKTAALPRHTATYLAFRDADRPTRASTITIQDANEMHGQGGVSTDRGIDSDIQATRSQSGPLQELLNQHDSAGHNLVVCHGSINWNENAKNQNVGMESVSTCRALSVNTDVEILSPSPTQENDLFPCRAVKENQTSEVMAGCISAVDSVNIAVPQKIMDTSGACGEAVIISADKSVAKDRSAISMSIAETTSDHLGIENASTVTVAVTSNTSIAKQNDWSAFIQQGPLSTSSNVSVVETKALKPPAFKQTPVSISELQQPVETMSKSKQVPLGSPTVLQIPVDTPTVDLKRTSAAEQMIMSKPTRKQAVDSILTEKQTLQSTSRGQLTAVTTLTAKGTVSRASVTKQPSISTPTAKEAVSTSKQPAVSTSTAKEAVSRSSATKQVAVSTPTAKQLVLRSSTAKQLVVSSPIAKEAASRTLTTKQPTVGKPTKQPVSRASTEQPAVSSPTAKEVASMTRQLAVSSPTAEEGVLRSSTGKQPAVSSPTTGEVVLRASTTKWPAVSSPVAKEVILRSSTTKQLVVSTPTAKGAILRSSTTKQLAVSTPAAKGAVLRSSTTKQLAVSTPTAKEDVSRSSTTKQLAASTPTAKEAIFRSSTTKQLAVTTPTAKEAILRSPTTKQLGVSTPTTRVAVSTPKQPAINTPTEAVLRAARTGHGVISTSHAKQRPSSASTDKWTRVGKPSAGNHTGKSSQQTPVKMSAITETMKSASTVEKTSVIQQTGKWTPESVSAGKMITSTSPAKQTEMNTNRFIPYSFKQSAQILSSSMHTAVRRGFQQKKVNTKTAKDRGEMYSPPAEQTSLGLPAMKQRAVGVPKGKQTSVDMPTVRQITVFCSVAKKTANGKTANGASAAEQTEDRMPVANQTAFDMSVAKQREESMSPDTWTAASMSSVRHTAPRAAKTKWNTVNTQKSIQTTVCPQKSKRRACTQKPKLTEMNNLKSKQIEMNTHRSKQIEMNTPGSKQIEMNTQRSEPRDASIQKAKLRTVTMQKPVQTEIKTSKSKHTKVVTPNLKGSTSESTDIKVKTPKSNLTKTRASKSDCTKASTPKSEQTKAKTPVSDQIKVKTSKSKETKAKTQKSKQISPSSAAQKQMAVNTQTRILKTKGCTATVGKGYPDRHQEKQAIGGWEQTPSQRMDKVTPLPHASSGKGAGRCHTVCANTLTSSVMKNTNVMRRLHFEQGESAYRQYKTKENMPVIIEAPGNSRAIVRSSPHQCDRQGSLQAFSNASHNVDGVHSDSSASCDLDKSILNDQNWFSDSLCNFSHRAARKRHYPQADGDESANHSAASWSKVQKVNTSTSERIQGWDANRKSSRERRPSTVMNTRTGNRTRMNTSLPVQPSVTPVHDDEAKYLSTPSPSSVLSDCNNGTHTVLERDGSVLSSDTADNETMSAKGLHVMPGSESSIHSSLSSEQGWMAADTWIGGDHVVPVLSVPDVSMAVQQDDGEVVQNMIMCQYLPCGPQDSDMPLFLHDTTLYSQPMQQTPSVNEVSILNFFFPTIAAVGDKLPTGLQTPLNGQGLCGEQPVSLNTNIGSDTFLETPGLNRISIPYQWLKLESLVPNDGQG